MPAPLIRRGLVVLGFLLVGLGAFAVALPMVASNRLLRDRIATEIAALSGYEVSIAETPEIRVWPRLGAELAGVTLFAPGEKTAFEAERITFDLSALAALRGEVVILDAHVVRPTLHLAPGASGRPMPVSPRGGRIAKAIAEARRIVADNPATPDTARLSHDALGGVTFEDGRVLDAAGQPVATALTGAIAWPALDGAGNLRAAGLLGGDDFSLAASSSNPLLLFGGAAVPLGINLKAAPVSLTFDGTASLSQLYVDGRVSLAAPSLRHLLEWSQDEAVAVPASPIRVAGRILGDAHRIRLEDAELELSGSPGSGALDLRLGDGAPVVSGTLAFDSLDLTALLATLQPFTDQDGPGAGRPAALADIDIRVSARRATLGSLALENVAATARTDDEFSVFDISDASAFGGSLQGGIRITPGPDGASTEFRLRASNVDAGAFGSAFGLTRLVPVGRGTVALTLKAPGVLTAPPMAQADGSFTASIGPGALSGLDLEAFLVRTRDGGVFALDETAKGTLPTESIGVKATIRKGVAVIDKAEVLTSRHRLVLTGVVTTLGRGLALTGEVGPATQPTGTAPAGDGVTFFVGGAWDAPYVTAMPARPAGE